MKRRMLFVIVAVIIVVAASSAIFAYYNYGNGTLEIRLTDPPVNWGTATQVYLNYSAIEIHRADGGNASGWLTVVDKSAWVNLTRTLNVNQTIGFKALQAGQYNLIRFTILNAVVTVGGKNYTATVPSGKLQIAITKGGIRIATGQTAALLVDLNTKVEDSFKIVADTRATPV